MSDKILVTYASRTGSTRGVAEAIGQTLAESGETVDVLPMQEVGNLAPYRAVVAGSAIQGKQWLPEALQFVRRHREELARKPFAAFLVCMTLAMPNGENYRPFMAEALAPVRALVRPVSEGLFAGALDIGKVPSLGERLKFRLACCLASGRRRHRDWAAIRAGRAAGRPAFGCRRKTRMITNRKAPMQTPKRYFNDKPGYPPIAFYGWRPLPDRCLADGARFSGGAALPRRPFTLLKNCASRSFPMTWSTCSLACPFCSVRWRWRSASG